MIINPGIGFGTARHPTTVLSMQALERCIRGNEAVLDFGSGSGILSITSYMLGASEAIGIETDAASIENARENLELNDIESGIEFYEKLGAIEGSKFGIVVCNIDFKTISRLIDRLKEHLIADGIMILSGLESNEEDKITELLAENGISILNWAECDGWIAIEGRAI
ncbi:MAG: methyltransferase [candidate division Zixibacteria bacterium]|nr:methyltransferase [candidate division Zixibacteria bacterium]